MELLLQKDSLDLAASEFLRAAGSARVFAVSGDMGAGKTTFITAVCRQLGVTGSVSSPTFSIINEYSGAADTIFHMDLYRLRDEQEAMQAGVEDALYSGAYCFVEWPGKAPGLFPPGTMDVFISLVNEQTRMLSLTNR